MEDSTTISDIANLRGQKRPRQRPPKGSAPEYKDLKIFVFSWLEGRKDLTEFEKLELRQLSKCLEDLEIQQLREEKEDLSSETDEEEVTETAEEEDDVPDEPLFSEIDAQSAELSSYSVSFESGASDSLRSSWSSFDVKGEKLYLFIYFFILPKQRPRN